MNSPDISEERLLADINKDLPPGIDWKQGAKTYLSEVFQQQRPSRSPTSTQSRLLFWVAGRKTFPTRRLPI